MHLIILLLVIRISPTMILAKTFLTATHHACFCSPGLCAFIDKRGIGFKMKLAKLDEEKKIEQLKKGNKNYEEIYQKAEKKV